MKNLIADLDRLSFVVEAMKEVLAAADDVSLAWDYDDPVELRRAIIHYRETRQRLDKIVAANKT